MASKKCPQVLAVDQVINPYLTLLTGLYCATSKISLTDEKVALLEDWSWKQAYGIDLKVLAKMKKVVLVPFSEAGQNMANMEVWIGK